MTKRQSILIDVGNERIRQIAKWHGQWDDTYTTDDWNELIDRHLYRVYDREGKEANPRDRFIKVAALAVAAVEALDRKAHD